MADDTPGNAVHGTSSGTATNTTAENAAGQVPPGEHVGLRAARNVLGELADHARFLDRVTYLTKHGKPVAAIVAPEAARTRAQLAAAAQMSAAEVEAMREDYERLHRAAAATADPVEVLWARAYLRLWETLERLAYDFNARVDQVVEAALAEEEGPLPDPGGPRPADWDERPSGMDYLTAVWALRDEQRPRQEMARALCARVAELEAEDARHPDRALSLDWLGWALRVEGLQRDVLAARHASADGAAAWTTAGVRARLAEALAETAALLHDLEQIPAEATVPPADSWSLERRIWDAAARTGGPLVCSISELSTGRHSIDHTRWDLQQLHRDGKVALYRYWHGRQFPVDPERIIPEARFHLVLTGQPPEGWTPERVTVVVG